MNDENNKYLNEKYTDIISKFEYKGNIMPFWFECGDGWFTIVDVLCADIVNHINNKKRNLDYRKEKGETIAEQDYEDIKISISQVKEKYGGMRFYVYGGDDYVRGMIDFAESMSYKTCEYCGGAGKLSREGWWKTLCDPCRVDNDRRKAEWDLNYNTALKRFEEENK